MGYADPAAAFDLPVGEAHDASFTLAFGEHDMQAWLNVVPARGGKPLDADTIYLALGERGVTFGIDQAAVEAACASAVAERFRVAEGVPAKDGDDTRFELLVAEARDRTPRVNQYGLIDFRDQGEIPSVAVGQPLMRRIPPTAGEVGRTVRGEVLEPVPGKDEAFADNLVGAAVAPNDSNLLCAIVGGQPVRHGNGVTVEQMFRVGNVDLAVGNVSFSGTVTIEGDVHPGMKVRATGDIVVSGVVDGAILEADGDVRIAGGAIARADIRAGGAVSVRFIENARVVAGTTISVEDTALQSDLQANNQILVGVKSPRGRLSGGSVCAMLLIQAPILGSPTGAVTELTLGVNPALNAEYHALLKEIEKQRVDEQHLDQLIKYLVAHGDKDGVLPRARNSWQMALKAWAKLLARRDELERELAMIASARIDVGVGVAGAVDVSLGRKVAHLRRQYDKGHFSVEDDRFVFVDVYGNKVPIV